MYGGQRKEEGESVILTEEYDPNYVPTQEEILEYATFLGMDMDNDQDLFWVAKEGLKAPLPEPWKPCKTEENEIYYFNFETAESVWEHPCDEYYKKMYQVEKKKKMERLAAQKAKKKKKKERKKQASVSSAQLGQIRGPGVGILGGSNNILKPTLTKTKFNLIDSNQNKDNKSNSDGSKKKKKKSSKSNNNNDDGVNDSERKEQWKKDRDDQFNKWKEEEEKEYKKKMESIQNEHKRKLERMEDENERLRNSLKKDREDLEVTQDKVKKQRNQIEEEQDNARRKLNDLSDQNQQELRKIRNEFDDEKRKVIRDQRDAIDEQKREFRDQEHQLKMEIESKKKELERKIEELNHRIQTAVPTASEPSSSSSNSDAEVQDLKAKIKKLEKEIDDNKDSYRARVGSLEDDLQDANSRIKSLQDDLDRANKRAQAAEDDADAARRSSSSPSSSSSTPWPSRELKEQRDLVQELKNKLSEKEMAEAQLSSELEALKNRDLSSPSSSSSSSSDNTQLLLDKTKAERQLKEQEFELRQAKRDLAEAQMQLDEMNKLRQDLSRSKQALELAKRENREKEQDRIRERTKEAHTLDRITEEKQNEISSLKAQIEKLRDRAREAAANQTSSEDDKSRALISDLDDEIKRLNQENTRINQELSEGRRQIRELDGIRADLDHTKSTLASTQRRLDAKAHELDDLQNEIKALIRTKNSQNQTIMDLRQTSEQADSKLSSMMQKMSVLREEYEQKLKLAEREKNDDSLALRALEVEQQSLKEQSSSWKEERRRLLDRQRELEREREEELARMSASNSDVSRELTHELAKLRTKCDQLSAELESNKNSVIDKEREIRSEEADKFRQALKECENKWRDQRRRDDEKHAEELSKAIADAHSENNWTVSQMQSRLNKFDIQKREAVAEIDAQKNEIASLKKRVSDNSRALEDERRKVDDLQRNQNIQSQDHQAEKRRLESSHRTALLHAQMEAEDAKQEAEKKELLVKRLTKKIADLEKVIAEKVDSNSADNNDLATQQLKLKNEALNNQVKLLNTELKHVQDLNAQYQDKYHQNLRLTKAQSRKLLDLEQEQIQQRAEGITNTPQKAMSPGSRWRAMNNREDDRDDDDDDDADAHDGEGLLEEGELLSGRLKRGGEDGYDDEPEDGPRRRRAWSDSEQNDSKVSLGSQKRPGTTTAAPTPATNRTKTKPRTKGKRGAFESDNDEVGDDFYHGLRFDDDFDNNNNNSDNDDDDYNNRRRNKRRGSKNKSKKQFHSQKNNDNTHDLSELAYLSFRKERSRANNNNNNNNENDNNDKDEWLDRLLDELGLIGQFKEFLNTQHLELHAKHKQLAQDQRRYKADMTNFNKQFEQVKRTRGTSAQHILDETPLGQARANLKSRKRFLDDAAMSLNQDVRQLRSIRQWLKRKQKRLHKFDQLLYSVSSDSWSPQTKRKVERQWQDYLDSEDALPSSSTYPQQFQQQLQQAQPLVNSFFPPSTHPIPNNYMTNPPASTIPSSSSSLVPSSTSTSSSAAVNPSYRDVFARVGMLNSMLNKWKNNKEDAKGTVDRHLNWLGQFTNKLNQATARISARNGPENDVNNNNINNINPLPSSSAPSGYPGIQAATATAMPMHHYAPQVAPAPTSLPAHHHPLSAAHPHHTLTTHPPSIPSAGQTVAVPVRIPGDGYGPDKNVVIHMTLG